MEILAKILIAFVAFEHVYILYFEMFAWETIGKRTFKSFPEDLFTHTKSLLANQGLYNGFLAAGLFWSLFITDQLWSFNIAIFFLACVVVAGAYGAMTAAGRKIFFVQALPALISLVIVLLLRFVL